MTFYAEAAQTAQELLTEFGQPLVMTTALPAFDDQGNPQSGTGPSASGHGVKLNYKAEEIDGSTVQHGDAKLLWSGDAPQIGMSVTIDGEVWRVQRVGTLQPGGQVVFYPNVQLRR